MQQLLGIKLDDLEYLLDRQQDDDQRENQIDRLDQKLITKFGNLGKIIPGAEEQQRIIAEIDHYLLLARLQETRSVNFHMRSTLVFKLQAQDLCARHAAVKQEDLIANWQHCNACYLKYNKRNVLEHLDSGLDNILGLARDLPKTQYRPYVLGLQFAYCAEIMAQLAEDLVDREMRLFYLKARDIALAVLRRLREAPDLDDEEVNKTSSSILFSFGGVIPKVVHNAALVSYWHKAQI